MSREFRLLGPIEASVGGRAVDLGPARQRCLLAALLVDVNHVVLVEQLVDRVWGERPPRSVRGTLHSYVSRLRNALAGADGGCIALQSGGYRLSVDETAVDVHRFRQLVDNARMGDDEHALTLFDEAMALWRGEPFTGLDTPWLTSVRATLEQERSAAYQDYVDVALRSGRHAALLPALCAFASDQPLDERAAAQLILALYRSGRQADALRHYQETRQRLAAELGTDPSPPLQQLHHRILTADPSLTERAAASRHPVPRQLPAPPPVFIGRDRELDELTAALDTGAAMVVSAIGGTGGMGKTWLALHWAHQHVDRFPDGQLCLNLRGFDPTGHPTPPTVAARALLDALGIDPAAVPTDPDAMTGLYRSLVADKRMLVLLDNARDTNQVVPLLPGTPTCTVLITSRNTLAGLVTTHGARSMTLDVLSDNEAHDLLTRHLGAVRVNAEPEAVDELTQRCAGLPLALAIVAARAATHPDLPLRVLADELAEDADRLDALDTGELDLYAVFSWSYHALTPDAAALFVLLGLAPGPDISLAAAACLADQPAARVTKLLRELTTAHLVRQSAAGRYRLHDLLRAFAARLAPAVEGHAALSRLCDHYVRMAAQAMAIIVPTDHGSVPASSLTGYDQALTWLETERANLLATATLDGVPARVTDLSMILLRYLDLRGYHDDALALHTHALAQAAGDPTLECQARCNLGTAYERLGRYEDAVVHLTHALALAGRDSRLESRVLNNLGNVSLQLGRHGDALVQYQRALTLTTGDDDRVSQGHTANNLGIVYERLGRYDEAVLMHQHALALAQDTNDVAGQGYALHSLGIVYERMGRYEDAYTQLLHARTLARDTGNRNLEGYATHGLGTVHNRLGHDAEALAQLDHALAVARHTRNRGLETEVLNTLGEITRDPAESLAHHRLALAIAEETGDRYQQALAHHGLARHNPDAHWRRALTLYADCGVPEPRDVQTYS